MSELDMSKPGSELFPELSSQNYNSYADVISDSAVGDPLDMGVTPAELAPQQLSDKELNFKALREEASKLKSEREYWKGQAEAYNRINQQPAAKPEPAEKLDWDDADDVRRAWETMRDDNERLRNEMRDFQASIQAKSQRSDWDAMVTKHVPELVSKNPMFAEMIQKSSNPYEAAYLVAELNARAGQPQQELRTDTRPTNAQRALANMQKPQTLASAGGQSTLSNADYYAQMSDEDFMKIAAKNLANV
jgi:hypothetical protein